MQALQMYQTVLPACDEDRECREILKDRNFLLQELGSDRSLIKAAYKNDNVGSALYEMVCANLFTNLAEFEKPVKDDSSDESDGAETAESSVDLSVADNVKPFTDLVSAIVLNYPMESRVWQLFADSKFTAQLFKLLCSPHELEHLSVFDIVNNTFRRFESTQFIHSYVKSVMTLVGAALLDTFGATEVSARPVNQLLEILDICLQHASPQQLTDFGVSYLIPSLRSPMVYLFDQAIQDIFLQITNALEEGSLLQNRLTQHLLKLNMRTGKYFSESAIISVLIASFEGCVISGDNHASFFTKLFRYASRTKFRAVSESNQ